MLSAYFDETIGGARNALTAVAGYLFDSSGLERFTELYRNKVEPLLPIDDRGRKLFRSAPCFDGRNQFFGIERPIRELILARMAAVIRESATVGVVVSIEQEEYEAGLSGRYMSVRLNGEKAKSLQPWVGSKYSLCLLRCIHGLNDWLDRQGVEAPIEYTIEAGPNQREQEEAVAILQRIERSPSLSQKYRFGRYRFQAKAPDVPALFAADYFVWNWQRNDRAATSSEIGDWKSALIPLLESKPHLASDLTEQSVNTQALVNVFNGL
jgi:hypothetical protein